MSMVKLRAYQDQSVYLLDRALNAREHPLCILPTGAGKSLVLAELARKRDTETLVLSHVKELLEQDSRALRRIAPELSQSFFAAGLKEKRGHTKVVFGSVQSVCRSLPSLGKRNLILIDEAHLCPRDADAMYARVFAHFSLALRAGFTATNARLDSGSLTSGSDPWFTCVAHEESVGSMIEQGYLVPLSGVLTEHEANLVGVGSRGGDFIAAQAEKAVSTTLSMSEVVRDIMILARKRRNWLVFAAGVKHAEDVTAAMKAAKIDCAMVVGDTPREERDDIVKRFRNGDLRALINVGVLSTGFDAPQTDCIVSLRPTKSPILWQQIMGRGMRIADAAKKNCLLLDFVGNLERLGGCGCVVEIRDGRADIDEERRATTAQRAVATKEELEFMSVSLADPMKSGTSFDCKVKGMRFYVVPSRKFPGKNLLVVDYALEDEHGAPVSGKSFVAVEYPGGMQFHARQWFIRRGISDSEQIPRNAKQALALAKILPAPSEAMVYWNRGLNCYMVMEERFSVAVEGFSADVPA